MRNASTLATYNVTIRYDERGLPVTFTNVGANPGENWELFYDDASRLVSLAISRGYKPTSTGNMAVRWHYHYLGELRVGATREIDTRSFVGGSYVWTTAVKRFWFMNDERGLPMRMIDEQGALYWRATWDASGWRTILNYTAETQVPFALPGQLILPNTEPRTNVIVEGVTYSWYRAPIAINQWRAYDPMLGGYLQPDEADRIGRLDPEGYAYARNSPVAMFDPTGAAATPLRAIGCTNAQETALRNAYNQAWMRLQDCEKGQCSEGQKSVFRRLWLHALQATINQCFQPGQDDTRATGWFAGPSADSALFRSRWEQARGEGSLAVSGADPYKDGSTLWSPKALSPRTTGPCLAHVVAHEALHNAFALMGSGRGPTLGQLFEATLPGRVVENFMDDAITKCDVCK